jgi:hypothetical protein
MAELMEAGAAEACGAAITEDARAPAPIKAATTGRTVDDDNLVMTYIVPVPARTTLWSTSQKRCDIDLSGSLGGTLYR